MPTFKTTLKQEGKTATGVEVPAEIMQVLGGSKKPAIHVILGGYADRSMVGVLGERSMILVSAAHRTGAGLSAGDPVTVTLELGTAPREVVVPGDLQAALDASPAVQAAFGTLSHSGQRQHTMSVEGTNNPDTRARRVEKAVQTPLGVR